MKTKWIAATAAGALGIGTLAAGAMSVAQAVEIRDAEGSIVSTGGIRGEVLDRGPVEVTVTGDHASVVSAPHAPTATSAASATQPPAQQPQPPAQVDLVSANTVGSAASIMSVETPGSPD